VNIRAKCKRYCVAFAPGKDAYPLINYTYEQTARRGANFNGLVNSLLDANLTSAFSKLDADFMRVRGRV
jgi:hypothetical protein